MLTRAVRFQVLAFIVISLAAVAFVGANYAGMDRLLGNGSYVVRLQLDSGGGIFTNSEVTYRGVSIGRVGELRLTDDGMEVDLVLDESAPRVPVDSRAVVANRSAIGEQYVDLQPRGEGGPFLEDGSVIPQESTTIPMPVTTLLTTLSDFNASVPTDALSTVVDELYLAVRDSGPHLQMLIDSSISFTRTAADHLPQTTLLIDDGATVLRTQLDSSQEWRSFSTNAKLFAAELANADGDLRELIGAAPKAATQLSELLNDTNPGLSVLVANLLTTANIFEMRSPAMEQLFVNMPKAVATTSTAISDDGGNLSIALTFFDPPPCVDGYSTGTYRKGEDTAPLPFNTATRCLLPAGDERLVRGSQHAPGPGLPPVSVPGGRGGLPGPLGAQDLPFVSADVEGLLWLND